MWRGLPVRAEAVGSCRRRSSAQALQSSRTSSRTRKDSHGFRARLCTVPFLVIKEGDGTVPATASARMLMFQEETRFKGATATADSPKLQGHAGVVLPSPATPRACHGFAARRLGWPCPNRHGHDRVGDEETAQRAVNVPRVSSQVSVPGSRTRMAVARQPSVFVARPHQSNPGWRQGGTCCRRPLGCCLSGGSPASQHPADAVWLVHGPGICGVKLICGVFAQWLLRHRASSTSGTLMVNHWEAPSVYAQPSASRLSEKRWRRGPPPGITKHPNAP